MAGRRSGLTYRIARVYVIQGALVSLATVLGVLATSLVIEGVLVKQALRLEAEHFWELHADDAHYPRPNTRHLLGLLDAPGSLDTIPAALSDLEPGYHRVFYDGYEPLIFVDEQSNERLFLIFDERRVSMLALIFGILPLSAVLVVIYLLTFLGWRKSRMLLSPLVQLSEILRRTPVNDPRATRPDLSSIQAEADSEIAVLVAALEAYAERVTDFVARERQFTRDASHELRTPLAVIRANMELLQSRLPDMPQFRRIHDTLGDMEALIETLLLLARSEQKSLPEEDIICNDLVINLMERLAPLAERKDVSLKLVQRAMLKLEVAEAVLSMVLTNLIRNAINYTNSGSVEVIINAYDIVVRDTGPGMSPDQLERLMQPFERGANNTEGGYGLGLAIVQRLCERSKWRLEFASHEGQGTQVRIRFPRWQLWIRV